MKRFWRDVTVATEGPGWRVLLDGRGVKTVGGQPQAMPTRALAGAMAAEWAAQGEEIDAASFILRDMADYALEVVAQDREAAVADLLRYAESDTLCYRADPEDALYRRQLEVWDPLLSAAEAEYGLRFARVSGIIHRSQPPATLARLREVLAHEDAFRLAALNTLTGLAASLVVGLAAMAPNADGAALWDAANLEEDWQADLWGKDADAEVLRARRLKTFLAAMQFAKLAVPNG